MKVGVFPQGPAPAMQAELYRREQAIRALVGILNLIRYKLGTELGIDHEGDFWKEMHTGQCVICGISRGNASRDLDTLFCARHCPVCGGAEAIIERG